MKDSVNKGFSLIELIIVVSIMAVLLGLLVPQYMKYINKSKLANDKQLITAIHNAFAAAIMDENIDDRPLSGLSPVKIDDLDDPGAGFYPTHTEFVDAFKEFVQVASISTLKERLKSREYKGQDIMVEIDAATQRVKVSVSGNGVADSFVAE